MTYFDHPNASNSDLKRLKAIVEGRLPQDAPRMQEIFETGTLIHAVPLEHHNANKQHPDYKLACQMRDTLLKDNLCRQVIMIPDFEREKEFYNDDVIGIAGKCKMDGSSKIMSLVLEYKGLAVTTQKAFHDAIMRLDYDQGAAWYLDVSGYKLCLIVAISKINPRLMFKCLIDRNHKYYLSGRIKAENGVKIWKEMFPSMN